VPNLATGDDATEFVAGVVSVIKKIDARISALESRRAAKAEQSDGDGDALKAPDGQLAATHSADDPRTGEMASNTGSGLMQRPDQNFRSGDSARNFAVRARHALSLNGPLSKAGLRAIDAANNERSARNAEIAANRKMGEQFAAAFRK